ncbi:hypothetical protein [Adhaeribacter radiodurans]|uniref:Uncharacterized protein n=1 Tax=Adhaeribacter radiodurans TaxID=2745197 RepID=A0A7L7L4I6_9BACT|nr:hypothetical protein [Adhaeribacter radiodurans]QMU27690.1 hypothetical protein HUW48_06350 [Adhaeribacter radiodurans]
MNPLLQLDQFLSDEGMKALKSKFLSSDSTYLPQSAFDIDYNKDKETYNFIYVNDATEEELEGSLSFSFILQKELTSLLDRIYIELEDKIFSINNEKERHSFILLILNRLDQVIRNWENLLITSKYSATLTVLIGFRDKIEMNLLLYSNLNTFPQPIHEEKQLELELPSEIKLPLPKKSKKIERLDTRQSALLYFYLRKFDAILNYSDTSLAKLMHALTGHSEQKLRTEKGLGVIWDIMEDTVKDNTFNHVPDYNLDTVKKLLSEVITEIDNQKKKNSSSRK